MDKLNHSDNITMNRRDLFNTLQNMIYQNLKNTLGGIYEHQNRKIFSGNTESGLLTGAEFLVARTGPAALAVSPGVATNDENSYIVLSESARISVGELANGLYDVYVKYRQNRGIAGTETPLPVKGYVNTETMYTMLKDACTVGIGAASTGSILLCKSVVSGGAFPVTGSIGSLADDLYMDDVDDIRATLIGTLPAWAALLNVHGIIAKVDNEYIKIQSNGTIIQRGALLTNVSHHKAGTPIYILSIIDYRHQSVLQMRGEDEMESNLQTGALKVSGSIRSVATRRLRRHPGAATISVPANPILWENRNISMMMITDKIRNMYHSVKSADIDAQNYLAIIADIRHRMLSGSASEVLALSVEMRTAQQQLMAANVMRQEMLSAITRDEISGYMRSTPNTFKLAVTVLPHVNVHEGIVQYEAEVVRALISSLSNTANSGAREKYYTERKMPTGYSLTGDPIYPLRVQATEQVLIPVSPGEKVTVRVRALDNNDVHGEYSAPITYEFVNFDDSDYVMYQDVYGLIVPDVVSYNAALKEYISFMNELGQQISSLDGITKAHQNMFVDVRREINSLERDMNNTYSPLKELLPKLTEILELANRRDDIIAMLKGV